MSVQRIHITGGPGAGKSWLARRLCQRLGLPYVDTDGISLELQRDLPLPLDFDELMARRLPVSEELAAQEAWISDGSNLEGSLPFTSVPRSLSTSAVRGGWRRIGFWRGTRRRLWRATTASPV